MKPENQSQLLHYAPEAFLDRLCEKLGARSLSALGRVVGLSPSVLSKVKRRRLAISSEILKSVDYVVKHRQDDKSPGEPSAVARLDRHLELEFLRE